MSIASFPLFSSTVLALSNSVLVHGTRSPVDMLKLVKYFISQPLVFFQYVLEALNFLELLSSSYAPKVPTFCSTAG